MEAIARIRSFNRTVTHQIGALEDRFLGRDRSLGASRLLFEIGADGGEVRQLRARLNLYSGYTSRLLRGLEGEGLIGTGRLESPVGPGRRVTVESASRSPTTCFRLRHGSRGAVAPRECGPPPRGESARPGSAVLSAALLRRARLALRDRLRPRPHYAYGCDGLHASAGVVRRGDAERRARRMRCVEVPSGLWRDQAHVGRPGFPWPGDWETYPAAARGVGAETARVVAPARDQQGPDRGASPLPEQWIPRGKALQR